MGEIRKFSDSGKDYEEVLQQLRLACAQDEDYINGHVLNSICTEPLSIAKEAYVMGLNTNLGDSRLFSGTKQIEMEVMQKLGELLGNENAVGNCVSGGTEANLLAMYVAKRRKAEIKNPEIIVPESIHFSVVKASALLGIRLVTTSLDSRFCAITKEIENSITENTIAIFATAGTSETGAVDSIEEIAKIASEHNLYLHVDAASGGFILPFAKELGYDVKPFDFSLDAVMSMTIDPHKYGLSVIPSGFILFRNSELQNAIDFDSFFVGTPKHRTFIGTRSAAGVMSTYSAMEYLGHEGFRENTKKYLTLRSHLVEYLKEKGLEVLSEPCMNIVMVKSKNPVETMQQLERMGWYVSVSKRYQALRIVVHLHNSKEELEELCVLLQKLEA